MRIESMLDTLVNSPRLSELLAWPWDFDVTAGGDDAGFRVKPERPLQVIAHDATGGTFALYGDSTRECRPVLFVSSEWQAGLIAPDLTSALQLLIALPYWMDCLKFSGGGNLGEMRRALPYLERETREDEPDIDEYREELFEGLGLTRPEDPLATLHEYVAGHQGDVSVLNDDGLEFDGLFGAMVVENNPSWKATA